MYVRAAAEHSPMYLLLVDARERQRGGRREGEGGGGRERD